MTESLTPKARVLPDTSAIRWSIRSRRFLQPVGPTATSGPARVVQLDPAVKAAGKNAERLLDVESLERIADLGKRGEIELLCDIFVLHEYLGTKFLRDAGPTLLGAPMTPVRSLPRGRVPRFVELQEVIGVGKAGALSENQVLDARHIWTAEMAGATHFLTMDIRLVNIVRAYRNRPHHSVPPPTVEIVTPAELLRLLGYTVP